MQRLLLPQPSGGNSRSAMRYGTQQPRLKGSLLPRKPLLRQAPVRPRNPGLGDFGCYRRQIPDRAPQPCLGLLQQAGRPQACTRTNGAGICTRRERLAHPHGARPALQASAPLSRRASCPAAKAPAKTIPVEIILQKNILRFF